MCQQSISITVSSDISCQDESDQMTLFCIMSAIATAFSLQLLANTLNIVISSSSLLLLFIYYFIFYLFLFTF